jgi:hypothetical protein
MTNIFLAGSLPDTNLVKVLIGSGDMILMRGRTQSSWLHPVTKHNGKKRRRRQTNRCYIRKVVMKAGIENYYHYNVGTGPVFRRDEMSEEMKFWDLHPAVSSFKI